MLCALRYPVTGSEPQAAARTAVAEAALLYDDDHLHALFRVADRYVRSVHTAYDSDTYKDSCVELFIQPPGRGEDGIPHALRLQPPRRHPPEELVIGVFRQAVGAAGGRRAARLRRASG